MAKIYILSLKTRPEGIEKILSEFKLIQKSSDEWIKDGITLTGSLNNLNGTSKFTIRIRTPGIWSDEEKHSLEVYERLKTEYAIQLIDSYTIKN